MNSLHRMVRFENKVRSMRRKVWKLMIFLVMVFLITIFARELFANISISQNPEFALNEVEEPVLSEVEEPALLKSEYLEATLRIPASEATPTPAGPKFVPFKVGERLEYSVGWGNINAGSAIMTIEDIIEYQGHEVYQVTVEANSNRFFSLFYKVRDKLESLIDVKGLFSRRYWTKQDEGNQKRERKYEFDQENNTVKYRDQTYYIRYGIQDEVSAIFYIRTLDLQVDTPVYVDIFARKQNWQVKCNILKTEEIDVPAGKFETILVEPELKFEGLMKKGKVKVWFTNDERRLPVQVNSKIVIGSITMKLERYQLGEEKVAYNK